MNPSDSSSSPAAVQPEGSDGYRPDLVEAKWQARWAERRTNEPDLDRRRAAVLQPHDVPLSVGRRAARGEHVRLHRQRRLRPLPAAAGLRRLRADRASTPSASTARTTRSRSGIHPGRADPAQHRELPAPADAASAGCSTGATSCPPPIPRYYKWTQWLFLQLFKAGKAYKKKARGQLVPQRQDRARQRAGDQRRAASAAAPRSSSASSSSGSSGSPTTPSGCSPTSTTVKMDWSDDHAHGAAQLDRPLRGRGDRRSRSPAAAATIRVFTTRPDTIFGATFMVLAPEHPLVDAAHHRRSSGPTVEAYRAQAAAQGPRVAQGGRQGEDRRLHRRLRRQPGHRRARSRSGSPTTC